MIKVLASNIDVFLETLPIIGISLVGIFAVTALLILIVKLLGKGADWLEKRKKNREH